MEHWLQGHERAPQNKRQFCYYVLFSSDSKIHFFGCGLVYFSICIVYKEANKWPNTVTTVIFEVHRLFILQLECQTSANIYCHLFISPSYTGFYVPHIYMRSWIFLARLIEYYLINRLNSSSVFFFLYFTLASNCDHTWTMTTVLHEDSVAWGTTLHDVPPSQHGTN